MQNADNLIYTLVLFLHVLRCEIKVTYLVTYFDCSTAKLIKTFIMYHQCIVSYRIVSYRIVSYRIVSYRIVSYRIVSYRIIDSNIIICPTWFLKSQLFYIVYIQCMGTVISFQKFRITFKFMSHPHKYISNQLSKY